MRALVALACLGVALGARADGIDALRAFARNVQSARAAFTQTVVSPDGARKKQSSGRFESGIPDSPRGV